MVAGRTLGTLMLEVAAGAVTDRCVKGGGLSLQQRDIVRMTADAFRGFCASVGVWHAAQLAFEPRVRGGQADQD